MRKRNKSVRTEQMPNPNSDETDLPVTSEITDRDEDRDGVPDVVESAEEEIAAAVLGRAAANAVIEFNNSKTWTGFQKNVVAALVLFIALAAGVVTPMMFQKQV